MPRGVHAIDQHPFMVAWGMTPIAAALATGRVPPRSSLGSQHTSYNVCLSRMHQLEQTDANRGKPTWLDSSFNHKRGQTELLDCSSCCQERANTAKSLQDGS